MSERAHEHRWFRSECRHCGKRMTDEELRAEQAQAVADLARALREDPVFSRIMSAITRLAGALRRS